MDARWKVGARGGVEEHKRSDGSSVEGVTLVYVQRECVRMGRGGVALKGDNDGAWDFCVKGRGGCADMAGAYCNKGSTSVWRWTVQGT